ncbi:MAG: Ig-like domain-containing protein [Oscillospiraceae bacterium]|nr:Ig-like domain-containing protein [Oscillospiraceae bacterium]
MSVIPTTTCRRCHRPYSSLKSRCPYCGTRKEKNVRRATPEADSSVRGTGAAHRAAENVNWQMTIGGVLLVLIILVTIVMVSSTVKQYVPTVDSADDGGETVGEVTDAAITPVPTASPEPTPTATPVTITSMAIYYNNTAYTDVAFLVGSVVQFTCVIYPANVDVEVTWSSSDESVVSIDENGLATINSTGDITITAEAAGQTTECIVRGRTSW